jgi:exonuclease SbcC
LDSGKGCEINENSYWDLQTYLRLRERLAPNDGIGGFRDNHRYEDLSYDPEQRQLLVEDRNGQILTPEELSHGTREQLYFATRVSLSEQLLGNESGFFILDDAFLPADKARLEEGFEVLQDLVANGWQVLYLTAKQEVGVEMVETFDLPRTELERLP